MKVGAEAIGPLLMCRMKISRNNSSHGSIAPQVKPFACPVKQNGNMQPEPVALPSTVGVISSIATKQATVDVPMAVNAVIALAQWWLNPSAPTPIVYTTCTEMFGSGPRIVGAKITTALPLTAALGRREIAVVAWCAPGLRLMLVVT